MRLQENNLINLIYCIEYIKLLNYCKVKIIQEF